MNTKIKIVKFNYTCLDTGELVTEVVNEVIVPNEWALSIVDSLPYGFIAHCYNTSKHCTAYTGILV